MNRTYPISPEWLRHWQAHAIDSCIKDLLSELQPIDEMVHDSLDGFCRNPRGTPADDSFFLDEVTKTGETTGSIQGSFDEVYFYGCRDMDGNDVIEVDLRFSVDPIGLVLVLEWQERQDLAREPDEY